MASEISREELKELLDLHVAWTVSSAPSQWGDRDDPHGAFESEQLRRRSKLIESVPRLVSYVQRLQAERDALRAEVQRLQEKLERSGQVISRLEAALDQRTVELRNALAGLTLKPEP